MARRGTVISRHPWQVALDRTDALSRAVLVVIMAALVVIVATQVGLRYLFDNSLDWAVEMSRLCFVWVIFLAIPHGIGRGRHVGVDLLTRLMPASVQRTVLRVLALLSAVLMAAVTWQGGVAVVERWPQLMPTLDISSGLYYVPLVICGVHSMMHLLTQAVTGIGGVDEDIAEAAP